MGYIEEKDKLKRLLDLKEIDEETFKLELEKLEEVYSSKSKKARKVFVDMPSKFQKYIVILIFIICFIFLGLKVFNPSRDFEYVENLNNLEAPIQSYASGKTQKTISGIDVDIIYKAEYSITGRVVNVNKFKENNIYDALVPIDIGLAWGMMSNKDNLKHLNLFSTGDRFLVTKVKDNDWVTTVGGFDKISDKISNNHLIPANDEIYKDIISIRKGECVKIQGYLVTVNYRMNNMYYTASSSISRKDSGMTACEIIYVTDITWLKEK